MKTQYKLIGIALLSATIYCSPLAAQSTNEEEPVSMRQIKANKVPGLLYAPPARAAALAPKAARTTQQREAFVQELLTGAGSNKMPVAAGNFGMTPRAIQKTTTVAPPPLYGTTPNLLQLPPSQETPAAPAKILHLQKQ